MKKTQAVPQPEFPKPEFPKLTRQRSNASISSDPNSRSHSRADSRGGSGTPSQLPSRELSAASRPPGEVKHVRFASTTGLHSGPLIEEEDTLELDFGISITATGEIQFNQSEFEERIQGFNPADTHSDTYYDTLSILIFAAIKAAQHPKIAEKKPTDWSFLPKPVADFLNQNSPIQLATRIPKSAENPFTKITLPSEGIEITLTNHLTPEVKRDPHDKHIGIGSFGKVRFGKIGEETIAIKKGNIRKMDTEDPKQFLRDLIREIQIGRALQGHDAVVGATHGLLAFNSKGDVTLYMPMPYVKSDELFEVISGPNYSAVNPSLKISIAMQIGNIVHLMHSANIIIGDLKPENLLLTPEGQIKLCDFGKSMWDDESQDTLNQLKGTPEYLAPALATIYLGQDLDSDSDSDEGHPPLYSSKSDVWALGLIWMETLFNAHPFFDKKEHRPIVLNAANHTDTTTRFLERYVGYKHPLFTIIAKMLNPDAALRPTAQEATTQLTAYLAAAAARSTKMVPQRPPALITKKHSA